MAIQSDDLLFEILTEELPARSLHALSLALAEGMEAALKGANLSFKRIERFATPRRLAVRVEQLALRQPDCQIKRTGPLLSAAFDKAGKPTAAGMGFARACGVEQVEALDQIESDKGVCLAFQSVKTGELAIKLLPTIVQSVVAGLPIDRSMRWGEGTERFIRPVHQVILMLGYEVVDARLFDIPTNNITVGHRFHYPNLIMIQHPAEYQAALMRSKVIASFEARRQRIVSQLTHIAETVQGNVVEAPGLVEEVTALVEWPHALCCQFDKRFLSLPYEVLVTAMQHHQKCFAIADQPMQLTHYFIAVSNINSRHPDQVIAGNERVMHARLSDAEFFYQVDQQTSLIARLEPLKQVLFHKQLGSLYEKTQRIQALATDMANSLNDVNLEAVERAAQLVKTDLLTQMVEEFPALQGVMGRYYARQEGESEVVAQAIYEHYLPRFADDELPVTTVGQIIALADRIDTLVGIFGVNKPPSGEKDPFALRRAALGVLRILIEKSLDLKLEVLLDQAIALYGDRLLVTSVQQSVLDFIYERHRYLSLRQGFSAQVFEAVAAVSPPYLHDFRKRLQAVEAFRQLPAASALAAANKRVKNILAKVEVVPQPIDPTQLVEPAEKALFELLKKQEKQTVADYTARLTSLASLQQGVDHFFTAVLVMAEDRKLRANRLALLGALRRLFLQVADISFLSDTAA